MSAATPRRAGYGTDQPGHDPGAQDRPKLHGPPLGPRLRRPFDFALQAGEIVGVAGLDGAGQTGVRASHLPGSNRPSPGRVDAVDASVCG